METEKRKNVKEGEKMTKWTRGEKKKEGEHGRERNNVSEKEGGTKKSVHGKKTRCKMEQERRKAIVKLENRV